MPVDLLIGGVLALALLLATVLMQQNRTRDILHGKPRHRHTYGGPGAPDTPATSDRRTHDEDVGDGGDGDGGDGGGDGGGD